MTERKRWPRERVLRAAARWKNGDSLEQIARDEGTQGSSLSRLFKRSGINREPRKRPHPITPEEIMESGRTYKELAEAYGYSIPTLARWKMEGKRKNPRLTSKNLGRIMEAHNAGLTGNETAFALGMSYSTYRNGVEELKRQGKIPLEPRRGGPRDTSQVKQTIFEKWRVEDEKSKQ